MCSAHDVVRLTQMAAQECFVIDSFMRRLHIGFGCFFLKLHGLWSVGREALVSQVQMPLRKGRFAIVPC